MTEPTEGARPRQPLNQTPNSDESTPSAMPGSTERMIGEFRLLRRLGRGGMAEVYLAQQTSLNRQVAIKILRPELLEDDLHVKRFEREAKAAAALHHPNIVQVFVIGSTGGAHFIAQEFVQGWNLKEYLEKKGCPDFPIALHIMKQVAAAIAAAGDAGIVHRDIKPENILITRKGDVKVADFGLAQLAQPDEPGTLTQVGITMGTPLYMSPEQVSGEKVDHRSDIYSFGVTCYRMFAGYPPFRGETALAVAMQHLSKTPEPLIDSRPDLPPILCQIVHKMMARNPDDRYPDAHALVNDLRRVSKEFKDRLNPTDEIPLSESIPAAPVFKESPTQQVPRVARLPRFLQASFLSWGWRKQVAMFAVFAMLVGGASAALGWWMRPTNPLATPPTGHGEIPLMASIDRQYLYAVSRDGTAESEEAWRAVLDDFPDTSSEETRYHRLATERLAIIYLKQGRLDQAEPLFTELVSFGYQDERLKAVGLAGLTVLAGLNNNPKEAQRILDSDLKPLHDELSDEMQELVQQTIERIRPQLDDDLAKRLDGYFSTETNENGGSPPPR